MKFTIPIVEKVSANKIYSGVHWAVRKKIADKYHEAIRILMTRTSRQFGRSAAIYELFSKLHVPKDIIFTFYFKNRPLDCSNCFFLAKVCEDGMVKAGILTDDSPKYVKSITCISKVDRENPRIEIELK